MRTQTTHHSQSLPRWGRSLRAKQKASLKIGAPFKRVLWRMSPAQGCHLERPCTGIVAVVSQCAAVRVGFGHPHRPAGSPTTLEGQDPYGAVSDAAVVLSGFHCDAELMIPECGFDAQLDFGHNGIEVVGLGPYFNALDFMGVLPDDNVDRYLRRPDRQANRQAACSGTVHLLWLRKDMCLILTPSGRKKGASGETAYERLGLFYEDPYDHARNRGLLKACGTITPPKMPKTVQRSRITLV